jgi:hypothetical protein
MIRQEEILEAQNRWSRGIVELGEDYRENKDFEKTARLLVEELYGYNEGPVLFKPTKASRQQFRLTLESAVSYFIGQNPDFPEDKGFALEPWQKVRFKNAGFILGEEYAVAMGNYFFTNYQGTEIKVEFTLGFFRSKNGALKINLHHSSLPFKNE